MSRLRMLALLLVSLALSAAAQTPPPLPVEAALSGSWTGVLEYRDYSEPAASTKRVQLPTWLTVARDGSSLQFHYIYDDGPSKVVDETDLVTIDATRHLYIEHGSSSTQSYAIAGLEALRDGRGELVLTGSGAENGRPADIRITLAVRRNLLSILLESRPAKSADPYAFRHRYVFTRSTPPPVTSTR